MAEAMKGAARAFLGQGLGMGWGDEAEAWARSRLTGEPYEQALTRIRQEYAQYAREYPGTSTAAEFAGGMAPALAMMALPGGQPAAAAQAQRTTLGALGRLVGLGAATGAVSGAGTATEGGRLGGATTGASVGAALGLGTPVVLRGASGAAQWLRERLAPTEAVISRKAGEKMTAAMRESNLTPQQIEQAVLRDRAMGVPSTVANVDAALADLAEAVAQRTGKGTRKVETTLKRQTTGARERTYQQVRKGLQPGDYYADEARLVQDLRNRAGNLYDDAYALGSVEDPRIMEVLKTPAFKGFYDKAREISKSEELAAKLRGEDTSRFKLKEIYKLGKDAQGNTIVQGVDVPDVRTLDYIKRGIDASIESGFKGQGMSTAEANALRDLRKVFVGAIDEATGGAQSPYRLARQKYAGDMEVIDAMRAGMEDFRKMDHEQVIKMVAGMGDAEKEAFRTGVARNLYGQIMGPAQSRNAASNIINSPEMTAKLQPLFDDPAHFRLFKAALEREAQLFAQASKILQGSQTAKRGALKESLEGDSGVGQAMAQAVTGGFWPALTGMTARLANKATLTPEVADKLAEMLMSTDPAEVAAVVKALEKYAAGAVPRAVRDTALERGAVMGATVASENPPPVTGEASGAIESELGARTPLSDSLEQDWQRMQRENKEPGELE